MGVNKQSSWLNWQRPEYAHTVLSRPLCALRPQRLDLNLLDAVLTRPDDGVSHATLRRTPYETVCSSRRRTPHPRSLQRAHTACVTTPTQCRRHGRTESRL